MSNLTVALAILGGLVLAGVVAHGAWAARKANPRRPAPEPREPVMVGTNEAGRPPPEPPPPTFAGKSTKRAVARIDALIDAIAMLDLDAPIGGANLLAHLPHTRRAGSKPLLVEGLNADSGEWEAPEAGQHYSQVQAGVQLANRSGALNEIEYSEFVQAVQPFSDAIGAMPDFPDMLEVVARARELDSFATQCDAQLAVHLHARKSAWSVSYIQQHAGRHGFVPGAVPGKLVLPSTEPGAPAVLTLGFDALAALDDNPNQAAVRDVTLSFDVPQTDARAEPFAAWQASAQALSLGMDAAIVDDKGQPLSPQGFAAIGSELGNLYGVLEARDLAAGSAAARRLFS